ncbi:hypothetical protein CPB85DRAFT_1440137 [Mucidula mucida]|nr:hypothetical protein CPB85DRAFT_1440137 [Mucidula mucida]
MAVFRPYKLQRREPGDERGVHHLRDELSEKRRSRDGLGSVAPASPPIIAWLLLPIRRVRMAPQLPIELIDNIVDSHRHSEKKLLLSLLSAARCFECARRYLYQYVKIDFEPGADKAKPLDVFLFLDLLSFYGADIGQYVVRLELWSVMLVTKNRRA